MPPEDNLNKFVPLNGLVLSGGRSSRMGFDKGALIYQGKTQRQRVVELLSPFCDATFISCNQQQAKGEIGQSVIIDKQMDIGPSAGILAALKYDSTKAWLVVACDLPLLTAQTISRLVTNRSPAKKATAYWSEGGDFPEPMVAIWEPSALQPLQEFISRGQRSPGKLLLQLDAELLRPIDNSEFTNVNTQEEYQAVLDILQKRAGSN